MKEIKRKRRMVLQKVLGVIIVLITLPVIKLTGGDATATVFMATFFGVPLMICKDDLLKPIDN